ncbi:hypothetical protein [Cupriavidus nantongensis]|uniref:hypothetical protein n=1 Tax=Cupriavidus nantongensis TaxID=1796606 RepID=UPI0009EF5CE6|nr:hypothetical protein [Cupriavidus nantongensis]
MEMTVDHLFDDDPTKWVASLPTYQQKIVEQLMPADGSYDDVARAWLTASAANTHPFGAVNTAGAKDKFLDNIKAEVYAFLCGEKKYKKEREGLFAEKGIVRTYFVGAVSVAVAPYLGTSAAVLAPVVTLILAGLGKITVNAWCATHRPSTEDSA